MKIGDPVWIYDSNRRVYQSDDKGRSYGIPIYREHWREHFIIGETRVSWIVSMGRDFKPGERPWCEVKIPKKPTDAKRTGIAYSADELAAHCWMNDHRYSLMRKIEYCTDPATLRKIADLIGYRPEEK
jgi:hypothetical protein